MKNQRKCILDDATKASGSRLARGRRPGSGAVHEVRGVQKHPGHPGVRLATRDVLREGLHAGGVPSHVRVQDRLDLEKYGERV